MTTNKPDNFTLIRPDQPLPLLSQNLAALLNWNWEKTAYAALIVLALATRFYDLGARVMSHDESLHTQYAWYLSQGNLFQHSPMMHGPLKFEVTAFVYWLFGASDFTARIPSALMGVAAVGLLYGFRKWMGRAGALAGATMMLISPYMLYYARYIRDEPYVMVWGLLMTLCVLHYMESKAPKWLYGLAAVTALFYATMETSFIYIAIAMLFLGGHLLIDLLIANWPRPEFRRWFEVALGLAAVCVLIGVVLAVVDRQAGSALSATQTATPIDPENPPTLTETMVASRYLQWAVLIGGIGGLVCALTALYLLFRGLGDEVRRFLSLDLLMVFGLFVLPQLAAFAVSGIGLLLGRALNPIDYNLPPLQGLPFGDALLAYLMSNIGTTSIITALLLALSFALGALWDWKRFSICAIIFWSIYLTTFTTFFTNASGVATGIVGSLGYWLVQQGVKRGGQPGYYYLLLHLPIYEFLPTAAALLAGGLGLSRLWRSDQAVEGRAARRKKSAAPEPLVFPPLLYLGFWAGMALVAFSIAGEKMPWLTTHIALPFILIGGWAIGQLIENVDWANFRTWQGWLGAGLLLGLIVSLFAAVGALLGAKPPFQGASLDQAQATTAFIAALLVALLCGVGLYWVSETVNWRTLLRVGGLGGFAIMALFTARAAFVAAYINYDYANEFIVYAHGTRGVKTVLDQVKDLSYRMNDGLGIKVAYDSPVAWPMTWYMRDYPNAIFYGDNPTREQLQDAPVIIAGSTNWSKVEALTGKRYYQYEYIRMVWPMQDYFGFDSWAEVLNGLPLAPGTCRAQKSYANAEARAQDEARLKKDCAALWGGLWTNKDYRQALWNIWFARDYTLYGQLTNQSFKLSEWPVADRMRMYINKDIAAQVWGYGVGPTALEPAAADPYLKNKQTLAADAVWGAAGATDGAFNAPRSVAVGPEGSVYVADSRNHRIQKFDAQGVLQLVWGSYGTGADGQPAPEGSFNEPWGVGVGPDGAVYVADTWNHRIQKFDANGKFIRAWGSEGQDPTAFDKFWGPRAVAVDSQGRVYVADTGNKRIVVFDSNGTGLATIGVGGQGGVDPGYFDEPVGVAVDATGNVFVADTWNTRIQQFQPGVADNGEGLSYAFVREWPIEGWFGQSVENKPYLATDARGRVYVTDPEGYRVLVFDGAGKFVLTWGDPGAENTQFGTLSGIAVDREGRSFVVDSGNNRIMRFGPLP